VPPTAGDRTDPAETRTFDNEDRLPRVCPPCRTAASGSWSGARRCSTTPRSPPPGTPSLSSCARAVPPTTCRQRSRSTTGLRGSRAGSTRSGRTGTSGAGTASRSTRTTSSSSNTPGRARSNGPPTSSPRPSASSSARGGSGPVCVARAPVALGGRAQDQQTRPTGGQAHNGVEVRAGVRRRAGDHGVQRSSSTLRPIWPTAVNGCHHDVRRRRARAAASATRASAAR